MIEKNKSTLKPWKMDIIVVGIVLNLGLTTIVEAQNEEILENQKNIIKYQYSTIDLITENYMMPIEYIEEVSANCGVIEKSSKYIIDNDNNTTNILDIDTSFKSYMDYRFITDKTSAQYKLQQSAWTDDKGLRRFDDYYLVAMGTYYSDSVGETFKITLETGNSFDAIIGDIKADEHTDETHRYSPIYDNNGNLIYANVVEFIVDTNNLDDRICNLGTVSGYDEFKGNIVKIEKINNKGENSNEY